MVKKFAAMLFLFFTLIFIGGQSNSAEAREVYCGTFRDGHEAYLLTETAYYEDAANRMYFCTVRAVKGSSSFTIKYKFWYEYIDAGYNKGWYYENSQGFTGILSSKTPVARNIFKKVRSMF